jgi:hypothetical protein
VTSSVGSFIQNGISASLTNGNIMDSAVTDEQMRHLCDYKDFTLMRPTKKWVGVGKWLKKKGIGWKPTSEYFPLASTKIQFFGNGYNEKDQMGVVTCTWYIKFKAPAIE